VAAKSIAAAFLIGIATRVVACVVFNAVILIFVAPEFLRFSEYALKAAGINIASLSDVLFWTLTFNAIFNALHVILSSIIAIVLFRAAATRLPSIAKKAWVSLETERTSE
jgi:predicted membrane protein